MGIRSRAVRSLDTSAHKFWNAFLDPGEIAEFHPRDRPTDNHHDHADPDGDPAVEHHVLGDVSEEGHVLEHSAALASASLGITGLQEPSGQLAAGLSEVGEAEGCGRQSRPVNLQLVQFPDKTACAALSGIGTAEKHGAASRGQSRLDRSGLPTVHIQDKAVARSGDGHLAPCTASDRLRSHGTRTARNLDKRSTTRCQTDTESAGIGTTEKNRLIRGVPSA